MAGINRAKISEKLYKQLDKKGLLREIKVFRIGQNAYGEKIEELYVATIKAYYYRENKKIVINTNISGTVNNNYCDKLLVTYNEESDKLKQDDYFILDNVKYKIADTGNVENIILDMYLERM